MNKHRVLIIGAGKIGSLIAVLLSQHDDYDVHIADIDFKQPDNLRLKQHPTIQTHELNINNDDACVPFFGAHKFDAVVSCLPYFCNLRVVEMAERFDMHYFDLTEDIKVADKILDVSKGKEKAFVPQCGLAPGIVGIIADSLMQNFDTLDTVKLRVGALPETPNNILKYALTWSTDGLINEYGNPCHAIKNGEAAELQPLEGLESISIDGLTYECFNTSGGIGDLTDKYLSRVNSLTYKSIRYPGHCDIMKMLMNGLNLNHDRDTLKVILENSIPRTLQDVVIIYVSAVGKIEGKLLEETYLKKIYSDKIESEKWGAIQITTASSLAAVLDIVLANPEKYHGFISQETFSLDNITQNRFGQIYEKVR